MLRCVVVALSLAGVTAGFGSGHRIHVRDPRDAKVRYTIAGGLVVFAAT
jgi:hypothetical protein